MNKHHRRNAIAGLARAIDSVTEGRFFLVSCIEEEGEPARHYCNAGLAVASDTAKVPEPVRAALIFAGVLPARGACPHIDEMSLDEIRGRIHAALGVEGEPFAMFDLDSIESICGTPVADDCPRCGFGAVEETADEVDGDGQS